MNQHSLNSWNQFIEIKFYFPFSRLWNGYEKIHKFSNVISYFSTKQWKFDDTNTVKLCDKLSKKDGELFDFDLRKLDWKEYFYHHIRGLRVYLIHDKMDTLKEARKKKQK